MGKAERTKVKERPLPSLSSAPARFSYQFYDLTLLSWSLEQASYLSDSVESRILPGTCF